MTTFVTEWLTNATDFWAHNECPNTSSWLSTSVTRACTAEKKPICLSLFPEYSDRIKPLIDKKKKEHDAETFSKWFNQNVVMEVIQKGTDQDEDEPRKRKTAVKNTTVHRRLSLPNSLRCFYTNNIEEKMDEIKIKEKMEEIGRIRYSEEVLQFIEESTRAQSNSLSWKDLRYGRITASRAHKVIQVIFLCKDKLWHAYSVWNWSS